VGDNHCSALDQEHRSARRGIAVLHFPPSSATLVRRPACCSRFGNVASEEAYHATVGVTWEATSVSVTQAPEGTVEATAETVQEATWSPSEIPSSVVSSAFLVSVEALRARATCPLHKK